MHKKRIKKHRKHRIVTVRRRIIGFFETWKRILKPLTGEEQLSEKPKEDSADKGDWIR